MHPNDEKGAPTLLSLKVTDLPEPIWMPRRARLGYDPRRIYFPRIDIPGTAPMEKPAPRPPDSVLYLDAPRWQENADGTERAYFETRRRSKEKRTTVQAGPLDPEQLAHFERYFEVVRNEDGNLRRWTEYQRGRRSESITYDDRGRIVLHVYYDRHGDPDRGSRFEHRPDSRLAKTTYLDGPAMKVKTTFRYRYDDAKGEVWRDHFDADGESAGSVRLRHETGARPARPQVIHVEPR